MALSELQFDLGRAFESYIQKQCGSSINQDGDQSSKFFLVVEFARSRLRLNNDSVGLILQSCFGGLAARFLVSHIQGQAFKFCVSSKEVGFEIVRGGNISNDLFNAKFLLWGEGDPDLRHDYIQYLNSPNQGWTLVSHSKNRRSYAATVQEPNFFRSSSSADHAGQPLVNSVFARLNASFNAAPGILTAPNNIALGRAGSAPFQKSVGHKRPGPMVAHSTRAIFCVRCLSADHLRPACKNRIRCKACQR